MPLLARGPGVRGGGRVEERLVSNGLDLLPTICEAAGATPPADLSGRSLGPLLAGEEPDDWRRDLVVETITGIGDGPGGPALARALVGERRKYSVYALGRGREQLVDLDFDPGEMVKPRRGGPPRRRAGGLPRAAAVAVPGRRRRRGEVDPVKVTGVVERILVDVPLTERQQRITQRTVYNWSILELCRVTAESGHVGWGETVVHYTHQRVTDAGVRRVTGASAAELLWEDGPGRRPADGPLRPRGPDRRGARAPAAGRQGAGRHADLVVVQPRLAGGLGRRGPGRGGRRVHQLQEQAAPLVGRVRPGRGGGGGDAAPLQARPGPQRHAGQRRPGRARADPPGRLRPGGHVRDADPPERRGRKPPDPPLRPPPHRHALRQSALRHGRARRGLRRLRHQRRGPRG